nr:TraX family protein [uncultured Dysosmobacter sp.]
MCTVPSPLSHRPFGGISANQLRCLAMFLMLLDHLWATLVPGNFWMTYAGRLAFPIFAFQISEGFFHTSDRKRYAMRLLAFALLSEIPFDLLYGSTVFYPFHQNVLFTLLLGLLAISAIDRARRERSAKTALRAALVLPGTLLLSIVGMVDYGWRGMLTVVAFYALRGFPGAWLAQAAAMILLNIVGFQGLLISLLGWEFPTQGFAVLALLPIWLYNGRPGRKSRALQYGSYAFYPVHMLILYLLFSLLR